MHKSNTPGTGLLSHLNSLQILENIFSLGKLSVLPWLTNIFTAVCDELK